MKVFVCGGGSGGHVTPVLAVITELALLDSKVDITFIAHAGDPATASLKKQIKSLNVETIRAGKLRRFHGLSLWEHLKDIRTIGKNIYDAAQVPIGVLQCYLLMRRKRPDVVFIKGGYVGLPVGIAARLCRIPTVTHDSDAVPGLTNRIVSRWATFTAVTMPKKYYANFYDAKKIIRTGLPISSKFASVATSPVSGIREELGLAKDRPVILVAAGSLGARNVNQSVVKIAPAMMELGYSIVHVTGQSNYDSVLKQYKNIGLKSGHLSVKPFVNNLPEYSRAADIVITRGGSMILELAAQAKVVISVPNPLLTEGHQLKNGKIYADAKAAVVLNEQALLEKPDMLLKEIKSLLKSTRRRQSLSDNLHDFYEPNAAKNIALLLIKAGQGSK